MRIKGIAVLLFLLAVAVVPGRAADPKLDGAYKYVSTKFQGGSQTEADQKGVMVVHGKYIAFVRAALNRKTWDQNEPQEDRMKKIVEAYQGLAATAGTFEIQGNTITIQQMVQSNPAAMGTSSKWEFKLEGKTLTLKPATNPGVEFTFERLP